MKKMVFVAIFVLFAIVAVQVLDNSGPQVGDYVIAREDIQLKDWESVSYFKPVTCRLEEGQAAAIASRVTYSQGSSDSVEVYWLRGVDNPECRGAAPTKFFEPVK